MFLSYSALVFFLAYVLGQGSYATSSRPAYRKPLWCSLGTSAIFEPFPVVLTEQATPMASMPSEHTVTISTVRHTQYPKPRNSQEYYSILEAKYHSIAQEGSSIYESNVAEIAAAEKMQRDKLAAIDAQADADYDRELTRDQWPRAAHRNLAPLELLHRLAITELHCRDHRHASRLGEMWLSWYPGPNPALPFDTRTTSERLVAYTKARKSGKIPSSPDIIMFEQRLADAYNSWFRGAKFTPVNDQDGSGY